MICNGTVSSKKTLVKRVENIFQRPKEYNKKLSILFKAILILIFTVTIITLGCVNTTPDSGKLSPKVLRIEQDILKLEKKSLHNIPETELERIFIDIEEEEDKLRNHIFYRSSRDLAYLLISKAYLLHLSQLGKKDIDKDKYWAVMGELVSTTMEALELIEESGSTNDMALLYSKASKFYWADSIKNLRKAHRYYKELPISSYSKERALTLLDLINNDITPGTINDYQVELLEAEHWGYTNQDYELLSTIRGLEYYLNYTHGYKDDYSRSGWAGITLKEQNNRIDFKSGLHYSSGSSRNGEPQYITLCDDILGIHWLITGDLSKPERDELDPYGGFYVKNMLVESEIQLTTDYKSFSDVVKISYDVTVDDEIFPGDSWFQLLNGTNVFYYKKGVGIVQYENQNEGSTIYLSSVLINEDSGTYLPLNEGNSWTYGVKGYSEDIIKNRYRVEFVEDDYIYFSKYNYEKLR